MYNLRTFNLLKKSILLLSLFIFGCKDKPLDRGNESTFKLTNINVEQVNRYGTKEFTFNSEKAKINEDSSSIDANQSTLIFYQENKPRYRIRSNKSNMINSGEFISLTGKILMKTLNNDDLSISADNANWSKKTLKALITGNVNTLVNGSILNSKEVIYHHKNDIIHFKSITKYQFNDINKTTVINIDSSEAKWYGKQRKFVFNTIGKPVKTKIYIR